MDYSQKRRHNRLPVRLAAQARLVAMDWQILAHVPPVNAAVTSLSAGGAYVELPTQYRVGTRFEVSVNVDGASYQFAATVRRVQASAKPASGWFGHGMQVRQMHMSVTMEVLSKIVREMRAKPPRAETVARAV